MALSRLGLHKPAAVPVVLSLINFYKSEVYIMNKLWLFMAVLSLLIFSISSSSQVVSLDIVPANQNVAVGDTVDVDIVIAGLGNFASDSLGAFDLDVTFDSSILSLTNYQLGSYLGDTMMGEAFDLSWGETSPGVINISELSFLFDWELDALQSSSFTLATVSFDALSVGSSNLGISPPVPFVDMLSDAFGVALTLDNTPSGTVNVTAPVPEPATILLFGLGLAGMFGLRRKFKA